MQSPRLGEIRFRGRPAGTGTCHCRGRASTTRGARLVAGSGQAGGDDENHVPLDERRLFCIHARRTECPVLEQVAVVGSPMGQVISAVRYRGEIVVKGL
jgi:hypothetical protein